MKTPRKPKRLTNIQMIKKIMDTSPMHQLLVVDAVSKLAIMIAAADPKALDNPLMDGASYKACGADVCAQFTANGYDMEPRPKPEPEPVKSKFEFGEYTNPVSAYVDIVPGAYVRVAGAGESGSSYRVMSRDAFSVVIREIKPDGSGLYAAQNSDASLLLIDKRDAETIHKLASLPRYAAEGKTHTSRLAAAIS